MEQETNDTFSKIKKGITIFAPIGLLLGVLITMVGIIVIFFIIEPIIAYKGLEGLLYGTISNIGILVLLSFIGLGLTIFYGLPFQLYAILAFIFYSFTIVICGFIVHWTIGVIASILVLLELLFYFLMILTSAATLGLSLLVTIGPTFILFLKNILLSVPISGLFIGMAVGQKQNENIEAEKKKKQQEQQTQ